MGQHQNEGPSLDNLARQYAELELDVRRIQAPVVARVCARCEQTCCSPTFCSETFQSPWLRRVIELNGDSEALSASWEGRADSPDKPSALGDDGCRFQVGRPPICTSFNCQTVLDEFSNLLERYAFQCIAEIPRFVTRNIAGKLSLVEIPDLALMTAQQRQKLARRLELARRLFDVAHWILRGELKNSTAVIAAERIFFLTQNLPSITAQGDFIRVSV